MTVKTEAKKYKCKQSTIDEQAIKLNQQDRELEKLGAELTRQKAMLSHRDQQLKDESEKFYEMRAADVVVTVFEEDYTITDPALILSQAQLFQEDFEQDCSVMIDEAMKLKNAFSEFYQHHNRDVRVSICINSVS